MINPMDLTGRKILVTGASSGIGRATAVLLSQLGASLVLNGRSEQRLEQAHGQLAGVGHAIEPFDLVEVDQIPAWMRGLSERVGRLDGMVHSAGITTTLPIRAQTATQADEVMRINWSAAWLLCKGFRQPAVRAESGSIVFISSVVGLVGQPGVSAYASSKGAVLALTKALAMELAPEKIRVNAVVPGHVRTEMAEDLGKILTAEQLDAIRRMHPLGLGEAEDVAGAIAFLLARTGRWITGAALTVDGGYTAR
jgi:NAD(P)-dependent dehydrogenase (short-subunit alcohol dehydrogenase family)